ncbi:MAG: Hsp20/alpha crystallin family protein [Chloroflexota bacterium]|nr:Hsp20/alpha crystallin family protein [Chloroflexota bacterium]
MVAFSSFGEPLLLRDAVQRLFEDSFVRPSSGEGNGANHPGSQTGTLPVDLDGSADRFVIRAMLPGVKPEDVDITCHESTLTIRATVTPVARGDDVTPLVRELGVGTFARTVRLPDPIDAERVETTLVDGILTLTLPKAEWSKPKKITVGATGAQKQSAMRATVNAH